MARWQGQDAWDNDNMRRFSVKVKRDLGDRFSELVKANGDTANAVFKKAMEDYIRNNSTEE